MNIEEIKELKEQFKNQFKQSLSKYLHKFYRKDVYIEEFIYKIGELYADLKIAIRRLEFLLHFNRLDEESCEWWEKFLDLKTTVGIEKVQRQGEIRAKWMSTGFNSLTLIQNICDNWKYNDISILAKFEDGFINLYFDGELGVPNNVNSLYSAIELIKPAHIGFKPIFKTLLIKDIHEVKSISEMNQISLDEFARG